MIGALADRGFISYRFIQKVSRQTTRNPKSALAVIVIPLPAIKSGYYGCAGRRIASCWRISMLHFDHIAPLGRSPNRRFTSKGCPTAVAVDIGLRMLAASMKRDRQGSMPTTWVG